MSEKNRIIEEDTAKTCGECGKDIAPNPHNMCTSCRLGIKTGVYEGEDGKRLLLVVLEPDDHVAFKRDGEAEWNEVT